jgi:potassium-dependent mechanosensitive channel
MAIQTFNIRPSGALLPAALLFLAVWLGHSAAVAASPTATSAAADPGAAAMEGGASALVRRLDDLSAHLLEVNDYMRRPAPDLAGIAVALPELSRQAETVLAARDTVDAALQDSPEAALAAQKMQDLDRLFSRWRNRLQSEIAVLDPWGVRLRGDADFLRQAQSAVSAEEQPALLGRLDALAIDVESTRQPLRKRLDAVVAFDVRVSSLQTGMRDLLAQLDAARDRRQSRLLSLTAPPIWKLPESDSGFLALAQRNGVALTRGTLDYLRLRPGECLAFVLVLLLLAALVWRLRQAMLAAPVGGAPPNPLLVRFPVATALLVWSVVGPYVLFPDLPPGIGLARGLLDVVLLWRVMPALVTPTESSPFKALLLLVTIFLLQIALLNDAVYGRLVNLTLAVLSGIVLVALGRSEEAVRGNQGLPPAGATESVLRGVSRLIGRVGPAVMAVAVLAEIAGARVLAQQALGGILFASLALCTFLAADAVLRSFLEALITGPGSRWSRAVRLWPDAVRRWATGTMRLVLMVVFLNLLPLIFPVLGPLWERVGNALELPVAVGSVSITVGGVVWFFAGLVLALGVARLVRFILDEDVFPRFPMPQGSAAASSRLVYYALVVAGILFSLAASGVELSKLTLVISALGVGVGFGLQTAVSNFVAGLVIAFERPFREGDLIAAGTLTGKVKAIGLRASRIRTMEGAEVIIPNSNLLSSEVTNWTLSDRSRRIEINVGVGYDADTHRVQQVLVDSIAGLAGVAPSPAPQAIFRNLGASSLEFSLYFWTPNADDRFEVESEARGRVLVGLRQAGIPVPFPQLDVHLTSES